LHHWTLAVDVSLLHGALCLQTMSVVVKPEASESPSTPETSQQSAFNRFISSCY